MAFFVTTNNVYKVIPDNSDTGLVDKIKIHDGGNVSRLEVRVAVKHPYSGDIEIALTSPSGHTEILHARTGSSKKNIEKVFKGDAVAAFIGSKAKGDWKITVKDFAPRDEGTLENWSIAMECGDPKDSEIFIPDGKNKKLISKQVCDVSGKIRAITASVDIQHGYIGDLEVTLVGPGASVKLHKREGGAKKNLKKTYKGKELEKFIGTKAKGIWALEISDKAPRDSGRIKSWHVDLKV